jgi:hypothetical protein
MSIREIKTFEAAIARLDSEERLKRIQDISMPHVKKDTRRKVFRNLRRKAEPPEERPMLTSEQLAKRLSGMMKDGK